jgi:glucose-1-phosphate thymidylyltransferase
MKGLILAAGYATRLRPLTDAMPKQLLPIAGKPLLDWILVKLRETDADEIHLVTNARFADDFHGWARDKDVVVHDDGTTSNEDRLGAIGDMRFVQERAGLDDDLLVVAGDNLFEFSLRDYVGWWRRREAPASAIAVRDVGDRELAKEYGIVDVDEDDRVVALVEKPEEPPSTLAAIATYLYAREHWALLDEYLREGNPPDAPGHFPAWLHTRARVYAYRFEGDWFDIGNHEQLLEADNLMRERAGLPTRVEYSTN